MPFTFSHPAIILPLVYLPRRWFSLTGLVIGSITPDFEYFLRMRINSNYSHTWDGLFWFDLHLGLLLAFIFHNLVRESLFNNLPSFLKSRLVAFGQFDWNSYFRKNWFIVIVSLLIGSASHLFWDSFTHGSGYFAELIPALKNNVNFAGEQVRTYRILQHSSSLLGALVIVFAVFNLPMKKTVNKNIDFSYWLIVAGLTISIITIRFLSGLELAQYGNVIVTAISAGLISITLTPILTKGKK